MMARCRCTAASLSTRGRLIATLCAIVAAVCVADGWRRHGVHGLREAPQCVVMGYLSQQLFCEQCSVPAQQLSHVMDTLLQCEWLYWPASFAEPATACSRVY
jgi:hypothetical protein